MNKVSEAFEKFVYRIGDVVFPYSVYRMLNAEYQLKGPMARDEVKVLAGDVVVGRVIEETHGGFQLFCLVRNTDGALIRYTEDELISYEDYTGLVGCVLQPHDA